MTTLVTIAQASKSTPLTEPQIRLMLKRGQLTPLRLVERGRILIAEEELRRVLGPLYQPNDDGGDGWRR